MQKVLTNQEGETMETEEVVKEYSIIIDADDIHALFKVVRLIQEIPIGDPWKFDFIETYDRIRDQIQEEVIN